MAALHSFSVAYVWLVGMWSEALSKVKMVFISEPAGTSNDVNLAADQPDEQRGRFANLEVD